MLFRSRPDLYFENRNIHLSQEFQVAWFNPNSFLQDCMFGGPIAIMDRIFQRLSIAVWQHASEQDWHKWWTSRIKHLGITPTSFGRDYRCTFFRPNARGAESYQQVFKAYEDWRDACILEFGAKYGFKGPRDSWSDKIVDEALDKEHSGYFLQKRQKGA